MPEITAILPAYNEEVAIGSVVLRARKYADRVIVVDDGSSDRTAEVAEMAGAEVIRHPQNKGKGAALKTCLEPLNGTLIDRNPIMELQCAKRTCQKQAYFSSHIFVNTISRGFWWRD